MQCTNVRERELEKVDQTQTTRYVSRFEHTALLRPRLHTEEFSLTRPHRTSHTRNLHWGFGANTIGSTQLLSQPIQHPLEARHKQITSTLRGMALSQTTITSHWGISTQSPPLTRGSQIPLPLSPHTWGIQLNHLSLKGYHNQWKVYNLVITKTTNNFFPNKTKIL